jgi:hypothetical protein
LHQKRALEPDDNTWLFNLLMSVLVDTPPAEWEYNGQKVGLGLTDVYPT